mgnify:CR=1 FL=1
MLVVDMHTRIILVHLNTHFYKVVVLEELVLIPQKIVMKVVMLNIHQHKQVIIQFLAYQMTLCLELL